MYPGWNLRPKMAQINGVFTDVAGNPAYTWWECVPNPWAVGELVLSPGGANDMNGLAPAYEVTNTAIPVSAFPFFVILDPRTDDGTAIWQFQAPSSVVSPANVIYPAGGSTTYEFGSSSIFDAGSSFYMNGTEYLGGSLYVMSGGTQTFTSGSSLIVSSGATLLISGILQTGVQTYTLATSQNNFALTQNILLITTTTSSLVITGITPPDPTKATTYTVVNSTSSTHPFTLPNNSASSTYPFVTPTAADIALSPGQQVTATFTPQLDVSILDQPGTGTGITGVGVQKNDGATIGTEPILDFEDGGGIVWSVTDDPSNTRLKIGAVGSGFATNVLTNYTGTTTASYVSVFTKTNANGLHGSIGVYNSGSNTLLFEVTATDAYGNSGTHVAGTPILGGSGTTIDIDTYSLIMGVYQPLTSFQLLVTDGSAGSHTTYNIYVSVVG